MKVFYGLFSSLYHFRAYPLRTCLSLLGIAIGTASIVSMIGIGEGTRSRIIDDMEKLGGTGLVAVQNDRLRMRSARGTEADWRLTWKDYRSILGASNLIERSSPIASVETRFSAGDRIAIGPCLGVTNDFFGIRDWRIAAGRTIHGIDVKNSSKVCVLGPEIRHRLFPGGGDPVGKALRIGSDEEFVVVGVMGEYQVEGAQWLNSQVLVPITTFQEILSNNEFLEQILLKVRETSDVPQIVDRIDKVLETNHGKPHFFNVYSQTKVINAVRGSTLLLRFSFGAIALIVLVVGGIGIMNLMLVSVIDRTREIGIRKAVGAGVHDIFLQFFLESIVLTSLGGVVGIALGVKAGDFFSVLVAEFLGDQVKNVVTLETILISLSSIVVVGVVFGLYPAVRAARLDPSRAVSYE